MNVAVLLSGGEGRRMGLNIPKQYVKVSGKLVITYCLGTLLAHPMVDAVQIVAGGGWRKEILADAKKNDLDAKKICGFSEPGIGRQSSVFHALADLKALEASGGMRAFEEKAGKGRKSGLAAVLIHDAVRPNLSGEQVTACFEALARHDGVMPILPMKDTVYLSDGDGRVSGLLDRERVFAGQAPEAFDFGKYYSVNLSLWPDGLCGVKGSTEPAVMAGLDIVMIPGDESNYKITTRADLERFRNQKEMEGG